MERCRDWRLVRPAPRYLRNPFKKHITEASLAKFAGEKSFARGAGYFAGGAVVDLVQTRQAIKARVLGSDEYRVELRPVRGVLAASCTCPAGEEGEFCKHAVAAGLAWLERGDEGSDDLAGVRIHLDAENKEALVDMLVEQAANDPELRARLQTAAMRRRPPSYLKAMKEVVRKAFAARGFVDMRAFIARADGVADLLRDVLENRRAKEAVDLADYALRRGIAAYQEIDDSGGGFGETLHQIAALHLEACRAANMEAGAFGESLFELQMLDGWGFFAFENYAPLLGKKGLARYRALAEDAWKKVPAREPGAKREPGVDHFRITGIMEALALHGSDVDALVAVKCRDLSYPYDFVTIAEILAKAGRHDEAIAWAERGRKAFPHDLDVRLVEFLIKAHHRAKRDDDAIAIAWEYFARHPGLEAYKQLAKCAGRAKAWTTWREKALAHIRAGIRQGDRGSGVRHWAMGGPTLLVEIFLHEGDSDAALVEARSGGCTRAVWMQLARAREEDHPCDAAAIYRESIESVVNRTNNQAYDEAAKLAGTIKVLMERGGQQVEFAAWLEALRTQHKAKRNFTMRIEGL